MILFVGLGNPTDKYKNTKHNIGFMVIDALVDEIKPSLVSKTKFKGVLYKENDLLFLKPTTYMNLSGQSVSAVYEFYKPRRVVVVHDDLDLKFGVIKFKKSGSNGGHNGLKSIDSFIGNDYERVRLGIGRDERFASVADYVLSNFKEDEKECLAKVIIQSKNALMELKDNTLEQISAKFGKTKGMC